MAMETPTTTISNNVQSVQRSPSSGKTDAVGRRGDGNASPFAPQTNVSIQSSIDDMSAILSKLTAQENNSAEEIPQQLQKIIQNVLQKSFSLEATLANGLGSTMESQRFSTEQLLTFARILSQMGTMAEKGNMGQLSDSLQAVLQNFKGLMTAKDASLEPALLNKSAFQLLNGQSTQDLSPALQLLAASLGNSNAQQTMQQGSSDNSFGFLKQLMQYLMPSGTSNASETGAQSAQNTAKQAQGQMTQNGQSKGQTEQAAVQNQTAGKTAAFSSEANTNARMMMPQAEENSQAQRAGTNAELAGENPKTAFAQNEAEAARGGQANTAQEAKSGNASEAMLAKGNSAGTAAESSQSGNQQAQTPGRAAAENLNRSFLPGQTAQTGNVQGNGAQSTQQALQNNMPQSAQQALQNTPQLLDSMKSLAQLLLKDANLTGQDTQLLQNFVNGNSSTLNEKDAKQLQLLLRLCQSNVPAVVQQAAMQQNMPDMPKLWAFMQLCDMAGLKEMKSRELKNASKNISDFATSMKHSWNGESSSSGVEKQQSMNFMMPLYMGDNEKSYPAYIHVYNQQEHTNEQGEVQGKETWLRLCVLTDNIGAVELVCQVYDKQNLNMRVLFSDDASVQSFKEYVPELQDALKDSSLTLKDFKFGVAGRKL